MNYDDIRELTEESLRFSNDLALFIKEIETLELQYGTQLGKERKQEQSREFMFLM